MHKVELFDDYTCRHVDNYPQPGHHCAVTCDPHPSPAQPRPSRLSSYSRVSVLLNTLRSGSLTHQLSTHTLYTSYWTGMASNIRIHRVYHTVPFNLSVVLSLTHLNVVLFIDNKCI